MKRLIGLIAFAALASGTFVLLRKPAEAFMPVPVTKVVCNGSNACCQGTGVREFIYDVQLSGGATVTSIDVGTHDNDPNHYVNRIMPTGWNLTIVSASPLHNPVCTAHGQQSTAQDESTCPFVLHFSGTTTMSTNFTLGYDFTPNWDIHDAEWSADNGAIANWGRPVGMGFGPVHSPLMQ